MRTVVGGFLLAVAPTLQAADHPRLVDLDTTRCTICHADLVDGVDRVHPPAAEDCTTCHELSIDGEATTVELLDTDPGLCLFCHSELEAAVDADLETPHFPVTDACLTCHDPHGSDQAAVLVAPMPGLCAECHDLDDLGASHGGQLTDSTSCARCHQPHGSDQPTMLAGAVAHPPFVDGSCDACHRAPFGDRIRLRARGERLCEACHGDVTELDPPATSVHAAVQGERGRAGCLSCHDPHMSSHSTLLLRPGNTLCADCHGAIVTAAAADTGHFPAGDDCLNCHGPHASPQKWLVKSPGAGPCVDCHDDQVAGPDEVAHGIVDLVGCHACHQPHGGSEEKLLRVTGAELCLSCHDRSTVAIDGDQPTVTLLERFEIPTESALAATRMVLSPDKTRDHPVARHPVAGEFTPSDHGRRAASFEGSLECLTCHDPHKGRSAKILRWNAASATEACGACHTGKVSSAP